MDNIGIIGQEQDMLDPIKLLFLRILEAQRPQLNSRSLLNNPSGDLTMRFLKSVIICKYEKVSPGHLLFYFDLRSRCNNRCRSGSLIPVGLD